jgi:hypothetical protein
MSSEAIGWVWKFSPYTGADFACHLAFADVVNDIHNNEVWARQGLLAAKARVSRSTANSWLGRAEKAGFVKLLEDNASKGHPNRYRFLTPPVVQVWDPQGVSAPATGGGVSSLTTGGVVDDDRGVSAGTTGGVAGDDTEPNTTERGTQEEPNATASPSPRVVSPEEETTVELNQNATNPQSPSPPEAAAPPLPMAPEVTIIKAKVDDEPSEDVVRLCTLLADLYHGNGNTRPNPNQKAWYRDMRLLLTKDGPEGTGWAPDRVETIIRWALADSFWQDNIRSVPKLRKQFDVLRGRRNQDLQKAPGRSAVKDQGRSILEEMEAEFAREG